MQVNVTLPDDWKPLIDKIARKEAYEKDKDYSYLDVIRDAIKAYCKIFDGDLFEQNKSNIINFVEGLKIRNPKLGIVSFDLYEYQKRYIKFLQDNRFVVGTKFRQGGFSIATIAWVLWDSLHHPERKTLFVGKSEREIKVIKDSMEFMISNLPIGIKPSIHTNNHEIRFENKSIVKLSVASSTMWVSSVFNNLIVEESAFIADMAAIWNYLFMCIRSDENTRCIIMSTPNKRSGWFYDLYKEAKLGNNEFKVFESSYLEHPDYNNPEWIKEMRKNLGEKGWQQEVEAKFLD